MATIWPVPPLETKQVSGFRASNVESIAVAANATRLFAGTADGVLVMYECKGDTSSAVRSGSVELVQISQLLGARSTSRDKVIFSVRDASCAWGASAGRRTTLPPVELVPDAQGIFVSLGVCWNQPPPPEPNTTRRNL